MRKVDAGIVHEGPVEKVLGEKGERALAHLQRRRFYTSLDGNQHGMAEYVDRMPQGQNDIYFITIPRKQWPVYDRPPLRAEVVSIESEAEFRILGALAHAGYMGKKFRRVGSPTPMTAL